MTNISVSTWQDDWIPFIRMEFFKANHAMKGEGCFAAHDNSSSTAQWSTLTRTTVYSGSAWRAWLTSHRHELALQRPLSNSQLYLSSLPAFHDSQIKGVGIYGVSGMVWCFAVEPLTIEQDTPREYYRSTSARSSLFTVSRIGITSIFK